MLAFRQCRTSARLRADGEVSGLAILVHDGLAGLQSTPGGASRMELDLLRYFFLLHRDGDVIVATRDGAPNHCSVSDGLHRIIGQHHIKRRRSGVLILARGRSFARIADASPKVRPSTVRSRLLAQSLCSRPSPLPWPKPKRHDPR